MASTSSKVALKRPEWAKALFDLPPAERLPSETNMIKIIEKLEACDPIVLSSSKIKPTADYSAASIDVKIIKSLARIVECLPLIDGGVFALFRYYLPKGKMVDALCDESFLFNLCNNTMLNVQIFLSVETDPKIYAGMLLACCIALEYACSYSLRATQIADAKRHSLINNVLNICRDMLKLKALIGPLISPKIDQYLKATLGSDLTADVLFRTIDDGVVNLTCVSRFFEPAINRKAIQDILEQHIWLQIGLAATERTHGPPLKNLSELYSWQFKFRVLSWCFQIMALKDDDPLLIQFWEAVDIYNLYLEQTLRVVREKTPVDYFMIATIGRNWIHSILDGVSKDNVGYKNLEALCKDLNFAYQKARFSPPVWKSDVKDEFKYTYADVVPLSSRIKDVARKNLLFPPHKTAPGACERLLKAAKDTVNLNPALRKSDKTTCAACSKVSDKLLCCAACTSVWYCNAECQKQHWKKHRKSCKTLKEGVKAAKADFDLLE
jgi:hypothetical protein